MLTLIPGQVDGETFTLDRLGELALRYFPKNNKSGVGPNAHGYQYYSEYLTLQNRKRPLTAKAYWLLLPKTILANSRDKSFLDQRAMIAAYNGYRLPRTLEVAASLLSHYARSQECLYGCAPWIYARCSERDRNGDFLVVGSFGSGGLGIYNGSYGHVGVSCALKF